MLYFLRCGQKAFNSKKFKYERSTDPNNQEKNNE